MLFLDIYTNLGLLSILFTDCWLLYHVTMGDNLNTTIFTFFKELIKELINGKLVEEIICTRTEQKAKKENVEKEKVLPLQYPSKFHYSGKLICHK